MPATEYTAAQADELARLGYDTQVVDGRIVVTLTVEQAVYIQAATICSKKGWPRANRT